MLRSPHVPGYVGRKGHVETRNCGKSSEFETNEVQTLGISWGSNKATARFYCFSCFLRYIPLGSWWDQVARCATWSPCIIRRYTTVSKVTALPWFHTKSHFLRLEVYLFYNTEDATNVDKYPSPFHELMKKNNWVVISNIFFIFTPIWGRFPIWLIFFKGVETTN